MAGIIIDGEVGVRFVAPLDIISNQPAFVTDSLSLSQQTARHKSQRWEITANLEPSNNSSDFFVHNVINGYDTVFQIQVPQIRRVSDKSNAGSVTVTQVVNAGVDRIPVNITGTLVAGEFIRFEGHSKVYMVAKTLTGSGTLQIYPQLRARALVDSRIYFGQNVRMECRYDPATALGIRYVDGILSDPGSIKFVEAI